MFRVFEDARGDVWIATIDPEYGLSRWERATGTLHSYSRNAGLGPLRFATAFTEDRAGNLWVGFSNALARYRDGCFEFMKLPGEQNIDWVRQIYSDDEGRLWIASRRGLIRIDSPQAAVPRLFDYTTAVGLASTNIYCVAEDGYGRMYAGTSRGIDCFYPRTPLRVRHYTSSDGLAPGKGVIAFRDHHGTLWFGTEGGLSRLDPEPEQPRVRPPVLISALRVRGVPRPISILGKRQLSGLQLGPDQNQLEVEFVGLGFDTGDALRYQHWLEGADTDWSRATVERRINFASLSPGTYRLLVRAVTIDGLTSLRPAMLGFTIAAPIWRRWWFEMLIALLAAAICYALYRLRLTRLLEVERLRTRIATDLHDDIGSTLSQIAILSEVASRGLPKEQRPDALCDIANLSRESIDSVSDIVWAIDPEQDRLADLYHRMRRFASDLFGSNGVRIQFCGPGEERNPELSAEMRRQIFLIFKESLRNIARHSGCTEVAIDFRLEKGWLGLTVKDNGHGFDLARAGAGHGLASMEQRAKRLGGQLMVDSMPGEGTVICIVAPLTDRLLPRWKRLLHRRTGKV